MKDSVDVIIPAFNASKYIDASIRSVLSQTYRPANLIIVDDGSTDNTSEKIKAIKSEKIKIKYIYQKNKGVGAARNAGIKLCSSKYIAFLDSDDIWSKKKLELQIKLFNTSKVSNLGVVYCNFKYFDANGTSREVKNRKLVNGNVTNDLMKDNIISGSSSSVIVKRSILGLCGYFDNNISAVADWDLWLRLSLICNFDFVDEKLVMIRKSINSMSSDRSKMLTPIVLFTEKHLKNKTLKAIPPAMYYYFFSVIIDLILFRKNETRNVLKLPKIVREHFFNDKLALSRTLVGVVYDKLFINK